ncbi:MAG: hypothetical protein Q8R28_11265 [Dehalococcoidia bacterium]|nr:hypothetical protein [Dehalococcoidia bacterium]
MILSEKRLRRIIREEIAQYERDIVSAIAAVTQIETSGLWPIHKKLSREGALISTPSSVPDGQDGRGEQTPEVHPVTNH